MSISPLLDWLKLPEGVWPPDHYTLLGLPRTTVDPGEIEERVLERMDRLRPHQLRHPDLVTEGMNRLAQALICLSDPLARGAYDATLTSAEGRAEGTVPTIQSGPTIKPISPEFLPPRTEQLFEVLSQSEDEPQPEADDQTLITEHSEDLESEPLRMGPGPRARVVEWAESAAEVPVEIQFQEPEAEGDDRVVDDANSLVEHSLNRPPLRWIYHDLAVLRRAIRTWRDLRSSIGSPDESLANVGQVIIFLETIHRLSLMGSSWQRVVAKLGFEWNRVHAVARSAFPFHLIRGLLPDQREAAARDWRVGLLKLETEYHRLRVLQQRSRRRRQRTRFTKLVRIVKNTPEAVPLVVFATSLAIALIRGLRR